MSKGICMKIKNFARNKLIENYINKCIAYLTMRLILENKLRKNFVHSRKLKNSPEFQMHLYSKHEVVDKCDKIHQMCRKNVYTL